MVTAARATGVFGARRAAALVVVACAASTLSAGGLSVEHALSDDCGTRAAVFARTAASAAAAADAAPAHKPSLAARAARFPPVQSVRVDFAQEREVSLVDEVLRASGRLWLTAPDRLRLELIAPEHLTLIAEGANVTVLDEQGEPLPLPPEFARFTAFTRTFTTLLLGGRNPASFFEEQWDGPDAVTLRPREAAGPLSEIRMRFPRDSPLPETIVLRERGGDRTTIHLSAAHLGASTP